MRTLSAILLVAAVSLTNAQNKKPSGKHNQFISDNIGKLNVDDYLLRAEISVPDVVVNRYLPTPKDLKERLIQHVKDAAKEFEKMSDKEKEDSVISLPKAVHSSQIVKNPQNPVGKREAKDKFNVDATAALYKQALDFLDKYDVELRFD